ncbi:MAG: hypothetical protein DMD35_20155 [Gemmatimonadetes bacterium]|nr:MAG: hypothetical protein DMD35_20155 [Gemmatimonadota bacterium]
MPRSFRSRRGPCTSSRCSISRCCSPRWSSTGCWHDAAPLPCDPLRGRGDGRAARAARCGRRRAGDAAAHRRAGRRRRRPRARLVGLGLERAAARSRRARDVAAAVARGAERGGAFDEPIALRSAPLAATREPFSALT